MQQPVGARQAAINLKILLQYALRIDRTKRHYPIPLQLGNDSLRSIMPTGVQITMVAGERYQTMIIWRSERAVEGNGGVG